MQERSLKALGEEYERTAMLVKERIARKRSELRRLGTSLSDEAYSIKRELNVLYEEHREAKDIAEHLKSYYDKDDKKKGDLRFEYH